MPDGAKLELIGPGRRLAEAEPDVVDHELAVDRIRDRLANLLIVEAGFFVLISSSTIGLIIS